jgi:hypothetical protein
MRYLLLAATAMAAVTTLMTVPAGPARAQMSMGAEKDPLQLQYERERQAKEDNEKAYNTTMKRLKAQAPVSTKSAPGKTVRPTGDTNR